MGSRSVRHSCSHGQMHRLAGHWQIQQACVAPVQKVAVSRELGRREMLEAIQQPLDVSNRVICLYGETHEAVSLPFHNRYLDLILLPETALQRSRGKIFVGW